MNREGFRAYLEKRSLPETVISPSMALVERFEQFANQEDPDASLEAADQAAIHRFAKALILDGANTWDNFVALARYGTFVGNQAMYVAAIELIDGAEAMENLHRKLGEALGADTRDRLFEGIALPALGSTNHERPKLMATVVDRLEQACDAATCKRILGRGLRNLEDSWYEEQREKYEQSGSIEAYLELKGRDFLAELEAHEQRGTLFFTQPITHEVIKFVQAHPEIASGVRRGDTIYETKIPHQAIEYLHETDPDLKRYHYCHCPWAKESLRPGRKPVSATFCHCSAAFHKRPYEVMLGRPLDADVLESVLKGDSVCRFAIHLPPGTP